jgi:hypothetical protein
MLVVEVQLEPLLIFALDEGEWFASCLGRFILWKESPITLD